jgi:hypothetical protein
MTDNELFKHFVNVYIEGGRTAFGRKELADFIADRADRITVKEPRKLPPSKKESSKKESSKKEWRLEPHKYIRSVNYRTCKRDDCGQTPDAPIHHIKS